MAMKTPPEKPSEKSLGKHAEMPPKTPPERSEKPGLAGTVRAPRRKLPPSVIWFGIVSFCTDAAGELIYPLVPLFLTSVLHSSKTFVGLVEGVAEATAALFKLVSGRIADRIPRKKPLVVFGYTLASVVRPLIALSTTRWHVLLVRFGDRVGKGVRSSPRDAMVAEVTPSDQRGSAFGYHRAMDNAGAVVGPLVGFALTVWLGLSLRTIFAWAALPGALAVASLVFGVREQPGRLPAINAASHKVTTAVAETAEATGGDTTRGTTVSGNPRALARYLVALAVFTLGNSSDAFLLVRAAEILRPAGDATVDSLANPMILLLWTLHNAVKALLSRAGGALSDRYGRRRLIGFGWVVYAATYLAFAFASRPWHMWALFAVYGLYYALSEGAEKALVADLAGEGRRGRAFGWFHATVGSLSLPASALFGFLYKTSGAVAAFGVAAGLAALAGVLLFTTVKEPERG